jgi:V-type H+-transporting ATPase subunit a
MPVYDAKSRVYPFGLDPVWKQSENELAFTNSLKMKLSVVFGVTQMMFGVLLGGMNHAYFRDWISFIHEFIPQVLFMSSVFGYMVMCMFIKWSTPYRNTHCAPSILATFIDMFLQGGTVTSIDDVCADQAAFFTGQETIQRVLLVVAFLSVPWMLFTKPLLLKKKHEKNAYQKAHHSETGEDEFHAAGHGHGDFDFTEEMVHQIIHTIEYVLGAVSNTASYLRLWALSLAHAQLSTVFWEKVMVENMVGGNPVVIIIAFLVWTCCTFAVLMVMESLSAFLHALRLHWVEFQNKFYKGAGRKFMPFKFGAKIADE